MSAASSTAKPATSSGPSPAVMGTYCAPGCRVRARRRLLADLHERRALSRFRRAASPSTRSATRNPKLVAALAEQASKLWHTSNLYRVAGQEKLAERLSPADLRRQGVLRAIQAPKPARAPSSSTRRYQFANGHPERWRIITFKGAFHGRTLATIASAGNEKYLEGFGQPAPGFDIMDQIGDLDAVEKAIGPETAGDHGRADPGRRRHPRRVDGVPARPARAVRPAWAAAGVRRGAVRHGPHGQDVRATSGPASRPT